MNSSSVGYVDRRHSWYTLIKIQENADFIKNADRVSFEVRLETIDGISNAVPDMYIKKGTTTYIGEVFAGQTGTKSNLATQTIRYCHDIEDLKQLRFFSEQPQSKQAIIEAWKAGKVLEDETVLKLFEKYDDDLLRIKNFEKYLKDNDEWFELIFNSNF